MMQYKNIRNLIHVIIMLVIVSLCVLCCVYQLTCAHTVVNGYFKDDMLIIGITFPCFISLFARCYHSLIILYALL